MMPGQLEELVENALQYSRCKRFIIEEYVEKYRYQIAGDGFSVDGKLVFRCFANEHFSNKAASHMFRSERVFHMICQKRCMRKYMQKFRGCSHY